MIDLSSLLEANQNPAVGTDSTGKIIEVNQSAIELLGYSKGKLLGNRITELFTSLILLFRPDKDISSFRYAHQELLKPDGERMQLEIAVSQYLIEDKDFFCFQLHPQSIPAEKEAKQEYSGEFFSKIIRNSTDVIAYFNEDFHCLFISPSCKKLLGYSPQEIYASTIPSLVHPDDRGNFFHEHQKAIEKKIVNSKHLVRLKTRSGKYIWISGNHHREFDKNGKYTGVIVNLTPYENEINTARKLERESQKFQLLADSMIDVITWLDAGGNIMYQSPSITTMLGYDSGEFTNIGQFDPMIHPEDLRNFRVARQRSVKDNKERYIISYRIKDTSGNYHWIESNIRNLYDEEGFLNNVVFTSRDITGRKQVERSLRESRLMYQYLADNSNDVIIRLDGTNHLTYISPACSNLIGYKPGEILAENFFKSFIYPDDRSSFERKWTESLRKREKFQVNRLRLFHKEGYPVWVEVIIKREYDKRNRLIQSIANIRDISDRVTHQLELEKIRELYQLAVEAGQTGIWDYSYETGLLIMDGSLKTLLGYSSREKMDGDYFWNDLLTPEDANDLKSSIDQFIEEGKTYFEKTFRMRHRSKLWLWMMGRGKIFYKRGQPNRIICSVTDITDRKESNEKLRNALVNFKAIFDAFPDLFFRVNRTGDFLEIMAGESTDFGERSFKKYEGKNLKDAFPESEYLKLYDALQRSFDSGKVENCEYTLELKDELNYYEARIIGITSDEAIGIVRNITTAVNINLELVEARKTAEEALNAKDEFLSMMSHEIRTPLNVVIGMAYLLTQQDPRPDQLKFLNTLKFSSDNLLSLINDLLDFSKIKAGKIVFEQTDFNLRDFVINIYESYKLQLDRSKVTVTLDMDENLPAVVKGDSNRLAQILNNLLSNAQKFTESGEIRISVRQVREKKGSLLIEFTIQDTGIGISPDKLKDIFEPFEQGEVDTTRKYGGTGLGLTIVRQLVELQQGTIRVESKQDHGSRFIVSLPLPVVHEEQYADSGKQGGLSSSDSLKEIHILYADDIASNQFLMKGYADLWKFNLDVALNGEQVLEMYSENDYDVIMLDLQMPVLDGFETVKRIRDTEQLTGSHVPVIAVTGDLSQSTRERISEAGMDDYLSKPVNPRIMLDKIIDLLKIKVARPSLPPESVSDTVPEISGNTIIYFDHLDQLYSGEPDQYIEFIKLLKREFTGVKTELERAFREENFEEFRRVHHSLKSNMKLMRMISLESIMDTIYNLYATNSLPPGGGKYILELGKVFDQIIDCLDEKLKILSD